MPKRSAILRFLIVIFLTGFLIVSLSNTQAGRELVSLLRVRLGKKIELAPLPKLTAEEVIGQINNYRVSNKLNSLQKSNKLDKAALARMTVIEAYEDFTGELTGVTLENAVRNNGYNYGLVGELEAINFIPGYDLTKYWADDSEAKKLLLEKGLTDVGMALTRSGPNWNVVVILARPLRISPTTKPRAATWGGIELWEAVNKRRKELGVNPLSKKEELCTIASIRLNQLLELGKLDGHAGLEPTLSRSDLSWIREKYNLAEFLVTGYPTPEETVAAWENTLGHRDLLAGGQYVWGCVYAQNTFGVAIVAY